MTKRRRKLLILLLALMLPLLCVEAWARLTEKPWSQRWLALAPVLDELPEKEQFLRDRALAETHPRMVYADYYLARPKPLKTETINYLEDTYSARPCPDSVAEPQERLWFFGGSTMENLMACPDSRTLANEVIKELNKAGLRCHGLNFGCRSFSSPMESVKFQDLLRRTPKAEHPTIVVFYDGYNDSIQSSLGNPGGVSLAGPLKLMVERRNAKLAVYSMVGVCGRYSKFCERFVTPYVKRRLTFDPALRSKSLLSPEECAGIFIRNVRMTGAVGKEFGAHSYFFLQPLLVTKTGLSGPEKSALTEHSAKKIDFVRQYYQEIRTSLESHSNFVDLSGVLDGDGRDDFFDYGHVVPSTNKIIGRAIAEELLRTSGASEKED